MKQKIILIVALLLILGGIGYMIKDMFFDKPESNNPWKYDMKSLRTGDSTAPAFSELKHLKPAMSEIHGIATDASGRIFIAGKDSIQVLDASGGSESVFGISGTALCIHIRPDGNILLGIQDHIEIYSPAGHKISSWKSPGEEAVITGIAATSRDIFVADAGNKIVYRYDYNGKLINKIGQKDPAAGIPGLIIPSPYFDIAIDPLEKDRIWIVNPGMHSLEKFDFEGKLVSSWGKASMDVTGFCGCCNPSNIALLPEGSFVTSEKAIPRVKIYSPKGEFVCMVTSPDSFDEGTKGLDLALGKSGEILVLDPGRNQLRFFQKNVKPNH